MRSAYTSAGRTALRAGGEQQTRDNTPKGARGVRELQFLSQLVLLLNKREPKRLADLVPMRIRELRFATSLGKGWENTDMFSLLPDGLPSSVAVPIECELCLRGQLRLRDGPVGGTTPRIDLIGGRARSASYATPRRGVRGEPDIRQFLRLGVEAYNVAHDVVMRHHRAARHS